MRWSTIISTRLVRMVTRSTYPMEMPATTELARCGRTPKARGLGPKRSCPPYSRKKLTPMAVIRAFRRGDPRSGR